MIITYLLTIILNIALAYHDSRLIKAHKPISHAWNGGTYFAYVLAAALLLQSYGLFLSLLIVRIPIFNTSLNLFRGLPYDYHNANSGSYIDSLFDDWLDIFGYPGLNIFILLLSVLLII